MRRIYSTMMVCLAAVVVSAQEKTAGLPGDTTLPSTKEELTKLAASEVKTFKYAVEDYFARPKQSVFKLSPDGKYFSYREKDASGKRHVFVKYIQTGETKKVLEEGKELIRDYGWVNSRRLIYIQDQGGNENYQLYAVDLDGSNNLALTPFSNVRVSILKVLKDQPDFLIIEMNKDNAEIFEPYKINIRTGALEKLYENKDAANPIAGYDFDKDGNLRGYSKQEGGTNYSFFYRESVSSPFKKIKETTWKDNFSIIDFDYTSKNKNLAYVLSNLTSNTAEIQLYDLKTNTPVKTLYSNKVFDSEGLETSRKRNYEIDYFSYTGEKSEIVPVSAAFKKLYARFKSQFGKYQFGIISKTDEEDQYLLIVTSDKLYGKYYTYDLKTDKFTLLADLMPKLKEEDMAEMRPVKFKSRDGLDLYGYITIPKEAKSGAKVPLIVNPHGGPYGPRDEWGFNPETQLFASRGYATIQVNYRGSGGYGKSFSLAGSKQIGRNMLNDLEDGVAYAKSLGFIDGDKVAIYGGSYGGLATLGSLVKTPELYKCGVDYVGVSNLFTFYKSFPPYWKPFLAQVYEQWYNPEDEQEKKIIEQISPALNIDKINKPLFVVQGANDPRVNIHESDQIVKSLRSRGFDVPYMVKYNEGHGFGHEDNRIELYKCMVGFFAHHLK